MVVMVNRGRKPPVESHAPADQALVGIAARVVWEGRASKAAMVDPAELSCLPRKRAARCDCARVRGADLEANQEYLERRDNRDAVDVEGVSEIRALELCFRARDFNTSKSRSATERRVHLVNTALTAILK